MRSAHTIERHVARVLESLAEYEDAKIGSHEEAVALAYLKGSLLDGGLLHDMTERLETLSGDALDAERKLEHVMEGVASVLKEVFGRTEPKMGWDGRVVSVLRECVRAMDREVYDEHMRAVDARQELDAFKTKVARELDELAIYVGAFSEGALGQLEITRGRLLGPLPRLKPGNGPGPVNVDANGSEVSL